MKKLIPVKVVLSEYLDDHPGMMRSQYWVINEAVRRRVVEYLRLELGSPTYEALIPIEALQKMDEAGAAHGITLL